MSIFASIENGIVTNITVADQEWINDQPGEWLDITDTPSVGMGWLWDGNEFTKPEVVTEPRMRLSVREFREQFTLAEKQAIYTAAKNNVDLEIFLDDLRSVEFVDLDFQQTIDSVNALETAGLIGPGRAAEILGGV